MKTLKTLLKGRARPEIKMMSFFLQSLAAVRQRSSEYPLLSSTEQREDRISSEGNPFGTLIVVTIVSIYA